MTPTVTRTAWTAASNGSPKPPGRGTLLMAVNADANPVDATLEGLSRFRRCEPLFDSRPVTWSKGGLRERFEPFGTRAWRSG